MNKKLNNNLIKLNFSLIKFIVFKKKFYILAFFLMGSYILHGQIFPKDISLTKKNLSSLSTTSSSFPPRPTSLNTSPKENFDLCIQKSHEGTYVVDVFPHEEDPQDTNFKTNNFNNQPTEKEKQDTKKIKKKPLVVKISTPSFRKKKNIHHYSEEKDDLQEGETIVFSVEN